MPEEMVFPLSAFLLMYSSEVVHRQKYFREFHSLKKKNIYLLPRIGARRGRDWRK